MYLKFISCLFCFCIASVFAKVPYEKSVVLRSRGAGVFSIFMDALSLVQFYDRGRFEGAAIDFEDGGLFYDPNYGKNWWEYYFEPVVLGTMTENPVSCIYVDQWRLEFCNSREYNHYLINKYIHLKPYMKEIINEFEKAHFRSKFVIGIHYRGGDKVAKHTAEAPFVPYEDVAAAVFNFIKKHNLDKYKIFVASDEIDFIKYMSSVFPRKVTYYEGSHNWHNRYGQAKSAIIDCLLLSKTHFLIRTSSNLSLCSLFFNPSLPYLELSKNFWDPEIMLERRLKGKFSDFNTRQIIHKSLKEYLSRFNETILIIGSDDTRTEIDNILLEIPQFVVQYSLLESKNVYNPSNFQEPIGMVLIASENIDLSFEEKSHLLHEKIQTICQNGLMNTKGLIVIDPKEYAVFKEKALRYLLENGYVYFDKEPYILQKEY